MRKKRKTLKKNLYSRFLYYKLPRYRKWLQTSSKQWARKIHSKVFTNKNVELEDYFDRHIFAEEILKKILERHAASDSDSSFVFGISGKWGEGKTHLLKILERKLKYSDFTVIWINPWKYADDKISLLRKFVTILNKKLFKSYLCPLRLDLTDFKNDQTRLTIKWRTIIIIAVSVLLVFLFYASAGYFFNYAYNFLQQRALITPTLLNSLVFKSLTYLVSLLISASIFVKVFTIDQSTKAVSSTDDFEDRLDSIVFRATKLCRKRVIIFVDDLDRTTPWVAKFVLDSLRTFFDKKDLSYVVTGDHTVLEKFIGKSLTKETSNQDEEGRRFLKKVFDIYWRIPLPTETQMKVFVEDQLGDLGLKESEKDVLVLWLVHYFDLNPRNIKRFIDMLAFNLKTFEIRKNELLQNKRKEKEVIKQIDEVLNNKILLARALVIEEKAYPLFEKIVSSPSLIKQIEEAIDVKNQETYNNLLNTTGLTPPQRSLIDQFLVESPRFFENGVLKVTLLPFFRMAGDAGLSDERGISLEAFERYLRENDVEKISQSLAITSDQNKSDLALKSQQIIDAEPDINNKKARLEILLTILEKTPETSLVFLSQLASTINGITATLDSPSRMAILKRVFSLLDKFNEKETKNITVQLNLVSPDDVNYIDQNLSKSGTRCFCRWLDIYLSQNLWDALLKFQSIQTKLDPRASKRFLSNKEDLVVANFMGAADDQRTQIANFLKFTNRGIKKLKNLIKGQFDTLPDADKQRAVNFVINNFGNKRWGEKRVREWLVES